MAITLGTVDVDLRLLIELEPNNLIEVGTISVPIEVKGSAFSARPTSFDYGKHLAKAFREAADQLDRVSASKHHETAEMVDGGHV